MTYIDPHPEQDHPTHDDTADPSIMGECQPIRCQFKSLPVHVALLHTGKVLAIGGSCNDRDRLKKPYLSEIWDPQTGELRIVDQELGGDIFCAGHAFLPDGRLLVAGGTYAYDIKRFGMFPFPPFTGLEQTYLFDPIGESWTRADDMSVGRWYPTLVTLGDGRVLCAAGFTKHFPWVVLRKLEIYSPSQGWRTLDGAERWLPLYPRLHLLPNGDVFYAGSYNTHYVFPFSLSGFPTATLNVQTGQWTTIGPPRTSEREEGVTVLLPLTPPDYRAKVLLAGGGTPQGKTAVPDAEIIDLSESKPSWRRIAPMKHARYYAYAVILPTKEIVVMGGRSGEKKTHHSALPAPATGHGEHGDEGTPNPPQDPLAVREIELFDPDTEQWRAAASMQVDRLYHSNALLLPDGSVLMCGSNPAEKITDLRIEIYCPPYMFKGPRPAIEEVPSMISYDEEFEIKTADAASISHVALIRQSVTTHCVNTDQRYVGLAITGRNPQAIHVKLPRNPNLAPPGFYMLFIIRDGIPSIAKFVLITAQQTAS